MDQTQENSRGRFEGIIGFSPSRADWASFFVLLVSLLVFFGPALFGGVYFFRDIGSEIVPKRTWWVESFPQVLWNPYMFFGLPEGANMQTGAFYPLNVIFFLGSVPRALSFYIAVHFAIAAFFAYLLARALRFSAPASLASALAFTYGGFYLSLANQVVVLNSAAWMMPLLWSATRALATGRRGFTVASGFFWALMVLGGEPEIAYLGGIVLVIFLCGSFMAGLWT